MASKHTDDPHTIGNDKHNATEIDWKVCQDIMTKIGVNTSSKLDPAFLIDEKALLHMVSAKCDEYEQEYQHMQDYYVKEIERLKKSHLHRDTLLRLIARLSPRLDEVLSLLQVELQPSEEGKTRPVNNQKGGEVPRNLGSRTESLLTEQWSPEWGNKLTEELRELANQMESVDAVGGRLARSMVSWVDNLSTARPTLQSSLQTDCYLRKDQKGTMSNEQTENKRELGVGQSVRKGVSPSQAAHREVNKQQQVSPFQPGDIGTPQSPTRPGFVQNNSAKSKQFAEAVREIRLLDAEEICTPRKSNLRASHGKKKGTEISANKSPHAKQDTIQGQILKMNVTWAPQNLKEHVADKENSKLSPQKQAQEDFVDCRCSTKPKTTCREAATQTESSEPAATRSGTGVRISAEVNQQHGASENQCICKNLNMGVTNMLGTTLLQECRTFLDTCKNMRISQSTDEQRSPINCSSDATELVLKCEGLSEAYKTLGQLNKEIVSQHTQVGLIQDRQAALLVELEQTTALIDGAKMFYQTSW